MARLDLDTYRKKLMGCWVGKNVGGILGMPYEGRRGVFDLDYYSQDLSQGLPANDDLDLQLVWLLALEKYGRMVDAQILSEYWISYIVPHWSEYGTGKTNLRMGLVPPLSALTSSDYKDGCGSFIRSEIWACVAPGRPEIAARYAYEDCIVSNTDEGAYGAVFCAALESAAFAESDRDKLIDIGLSYIPVDCGVAKGVRSALSAYEAGLTWQEARVQVMNDVPGTFGLQGVKFGEEPKDVAAGKRGWDTPSNIALTMIGWLYGEGDFGKSLCIAVNCGEDTDCTGATLGSILGILHGIDGIPQKWLEPVGDKLVTVCIDLTATSKIPKTATEMTERIIRLTPAFLGGDICDFVNAGKGYTIDMLEGKDLYLRPRWSNYWVCEDYLKDLQEYMHAVRYETPLYTAYLDYFDGPLIEQGAPKRFKLTLLNRIPQPQWLSLDFLLPDDLAVTPLRSMSAFLDVSAQGRTIVEFELTAAAVTKGKYEMILSIGSNGHPTKLLIPIVLIAGRFQPRVVDNPS